MNMNRNKPPDGSYFYVVEAELTAGTMASTSTTPAVTVGPDTFIWEAIGAYWDNTAGIWHVRISDQGGNKLFSANEISVNALVGVDMQPYRLLLPWEFRGGSAIQVEATNTGSGTDTLHLQFIGRRIPSPPVA